MFVSDVNYHNPQWHRFMEGTRHKTTDRSNINLHQPNPGSVVQWSVFILRTQYHKYSTYEDATIKRNWSQFSKSVFQSLFPHHSTGSFWRRGYRLETILIYIRLEIQGWKSITFWPLQFNIFMSQSMFYLSTSIVFLEDSWSFHISIQGKFLGWYECDDNFSPNIWMSRKWIKTLRLPNFIMT